MGCAQISRESWFNAINQCRGGGRNRDVWVGATGSVKKI